MVHAVHCVHPFAGLQTRHCAELTPAILFADLKEPLNFLRIHLLFSRKQIELSIEASSLNIYEERKEMTSSKYILAAVIALLVIGLLVKFYGCEPGENADMNAEAEREYEEHAPPGDNGDPERHIDMDTGEDDEEDPRPSRHLIEEVHEEESEPELPDGFPPSLRWRVVALNPSLLSREHVVKGDKIELNLFPDAIYEAVVERVSRDVAGSLGIRGRIKHYQYAYILMSRSEDGHVLINITIPEDRRGYRILAAPDAEEDVHYVLELNMEKQDVLPPGPPLRVPPQD